MRWPPPQKQPASTQPGGEVNRARPTTIELHATCFIHDPMARITVHTYANLRQYTDNRPTVDVTIEPGQTVKSVLSRLAIPHGQVHIVFVNHRTVDPEHALDDHDRVDLFSAVGGG